MRFSVRYGYEKPLKEMSPEHISDELRASLWNLVSPRFPRDGDLIAASTEEIDIYRMVWTDFLHLTIDSIHPNPDSARREILQIYDEFKWYRVYDFVEWLVENNFIDERAVNRVLRSHAAAYRVIQRRIIPITSDAELNEIKQSIQSGPDSVSNHVRESVRLLSNRNTSDYRNVIKEAISAVEAACQEVTGSKSSLGKCIKQVSRNANQHKAFEDAVSKLYGWCSDSSGIRHASTGEETPIDRATAKCMLVISSALANFILEKSTKGDSA